MNIAAIKDLATGRFVEKKEHVILYGPPGVGNTRIAQALGEPGLPHRALHLVTHHETVQKAAQRPVPTGTGEKDAAEVAQAGPVETTSA